MSYIDWNIAKRSGHGGGYSLDSDGRIFFRDGTGEKSCGYRLSLYSSVPNIIRESKEIMFGASDNGDFFLRTDIIEGAETFPMKKNDKGTSFSVYGKDLVLKAIKTLTGINPSGDVEVKYDLKKINDTTFKFTNVEIL